MAALLGRDRAQWLVVVALVAACNGVAAPVLIALERKGWLGALFDTGGVNPIFWFTGLVAAGIAFEPGAEERLDRWDLMVAGLVLALAFLPIVSAGSAGVLLAGVWLFVRSAAGTRARRAAIVLLALTTSLVWGHFFLMFLGDRIVMLDGRFVAWLAGTSAEGNLVANVGGPGRILIAYGCSSLHNITMAIQFWVAMTQLLRIPMSPKVVLLGLAAVVGNVLVNGLRLATIAHNPDRFDYWHTGGGGTIFAWAAVFTVAAIVMAGCNALAPRRL